MSSNRLASTLKLYQGKALSLLTRHGKERVIGPALAARCGCEVVHTDAFDTDQLGTFTRDIPRAGTQREAAVRKARLGMALTGLRIGLASEGAFAPDPYTGLLSWNYELVVLVDDERGLELAGFFSGQSQSDSMYAANWTEVLQFADKARFPEHHLVVRPDSADHAQVRKGLDTLGSLRQAFDWAMSLASTGKVFLENDLRAHTNPSRMANIQKAAVDLAEQMNSPCPACASPGFWVRDLRRGLACQACGAPTREPIAKVWTCPKCDTRSETRLSVGTFADPGRCDFCNP